MTTKAGVGTSHHHNPHVAGRESAEQALKEASIAKADFVFMFATVGYDQHSLLHAVREATGGAPLTGCSAEGTINGDDADESNISVVVTALYPAADRPPEPREYPVFKVHSRLLGTNPECL